MRPLATVAFTFVLAGCAAAHAPEDAGPPAPDAGHDAATIIPCTCDRVLCELDPARGDPCLECCGSPSGAGYCCDWSSCPASGCRCGDGLACATPLACCHFGWNPDLALTCVDIDTYYRNRCDSGPAPG